MDAIDRSNLKVSETDMAELLKVDRNEWRQEAESIREHYARFGARLPAALARELEALAARLSAAPQPV
jgi:phosphoenolpyruvate carboxykinase (GTP)